MEEENKNIDIDIYKVGGYYGMISIKDFNKPQNKSLFKPILLTF